MLNFSQSSGFPGFQAWFQVDFYRNKASHTPAAISPSQGRLELLAVRNGTPYDCYVTRILHFIFFYQLYLMILRSLNGFIQLAYHCKIVCRLNADTFELHTSAFNQLINKQNLF